MPNTITLPDVPIGEFVPHLEHHEELDWLTYLEHDRSIIERPQAKSNIVLLYDAHTNELVGLRIEGYSHLPFHTYPKSPG